MGAGVVTGRTGKVTSGTGQLYPVEDTMGRGVVSGSGTQAGCVTSSLTIGSGKASLDTEKNQPKKGENKPKMYKNGI